MTTQSPRTGAPRLAPPTAPALPPRGANQTWQSCTKQSYLRYLYSPQGQAEFRLGFPWVGVAVAGVLFLTIIGIPAAIGHGIGMMIRHSQRKKKFDQHVAFAKRGQPVFVYPIMVNTLLRQFQNQRAPGLVMGSFDGLDEEYFANLAMVLESISNADASALPPAEAALKQALTDEKYVENRRRRIPDELTGGMPVYLFDLMIDGRKLIGGRLMTPRILCMADPGDRGVIFNIPHHTIDVPADLSPRTATVPETPDDPHISDECFALVPSASAPVGPDHPIHAVIDDVSASCPRCCAPIVSLITLRLDAPDLRSLAAKLLAPRPQRIRVVVCEHCCEECLYTFAAFDPLGQLIPNSVRVRKDADDQDFPPSSPEHRTPAAGAQRRWNRDALRLNPIPHPPNAAIEYALGSGSSHVGGLPRWIQDPEAPPCPSCQHTMPFLAHIDEGDLGDGGVDLFAFWCPACSTTAVVPQQS